MIPERNFQPCSVGKQSTGFMRAGIEVDERLLYSVSFQNITLATSNDIREAVEISSSSSNKEFQDMPDAETQASSFCRTQRPHAEARALYNHYTK